MSVRYCKDKHGQAMVEFAIIIPFFMLMLYGFSYLAMFFHDYLTLNELTRDIARHEAVGIHFADIRTNYTSTTFLTDVYLFQPAKAGAVVVKNTDEKNSSGTIIGTSITVTLTATANVTEGSLWKKILPNTISTSLTMRKEE